MAKPTSEKPAETTTTEAPKSQAAAAAAAATAAQTTSEADTGEYDRLKAEQRSKVPTRYVNCGQARIQYSPNLRGNNSRLLFMEFGMDDIKTLLLAMLQGTALRAGVATVSSIVSYERGNWTIVDPTVSLLSDTQETFGDRKAKAEEVLSERRELFAAFLSPEEIQGAVDAAGAADEKDKDVRDKLRVANTQRSRQPQESTGNSAPSGEAVGDEEEAPAPAARR